MEMMELEDLENGTRAEKRSRALDQEEVWTTVQRSKTRLSRSTSEAEIINNNTGPEEIIEVNITSKEKLPKQIGLARLLKSENIKDVARVSFIYLGCMLVVLALSHLHWWLEELLSHGTLMHSDIAWVFSLLLNLVGYSVVLLPAFIMYHALNKINFFEKNAMKTWLSQGLFACFGSPGERLPDTVRDVGGAPAVGAGGAGAGAGGAELLFCLSGLVGAYLVWGLLQEKIMTQKYVLADGSSVQFADSQFLVFTNRLSALLLAAAALLYKGVPLAAAPLYKFSYCSVSNIVSAWSQYEALKYVGFPTQVLSKSCKVVPVMLMGTLVSRTSYPLSDYVSAGFISAGMLAFLTATDQDAVSTSTTASGLILLALYMASDSFTSNWQQRLYHQYKLTPMQMMYGVNLYSCLLTGAAMYNRAGGLSEEQWRLLQHPMFLCDVAVLALASALGQLLIYRTIARFGAALFTVIMTVRQAISILLSCLVYGHRIAPWGVLGVAVVFAAALSRVYRRRAAPRPA
ncbi:adenosine 3'-phospho 5'-phosphosulfate transporter 1 isoform X1 [Plutella xylostella]|uniref:adenosine 3'-phospho 5'-phosphosulfate transporter 1 isoform X1 n=1 Tax=Plutella xylostella TaxID=51655 RepID=UPI00203228A5|nr:adenosine 3'-phospho 5'-phosphosulfate transporter 1 isoform X1 [Plutella xylostella]